MCSDESFVTHKACVSTTFILLNENPPVHSRVSLSTYLLKYTNYGNRAYFWGYREIALCLHSKFPPPRAKYMYLSLSVLPIHGIAM